MTIILMLMGQFYLAMPLTAAASTFYTVHESYNAKRAKIHKDVNKESESGKSESEKASTSTTGQSGGYS
jgi:hypothetical protein